jgi:folate-dependent phosphoribosylglycinamide formyltransferase PurN
MYRIGWFSTGRDEAARELLKTVQSSIQRGELEARPCFVFSNREPGESPESDLFFDLVKSYNLPLIHFSSKKFNAPRTPRHHPAWRREYDREVMSRLRDFQPHLCVLAGYMLIVGEEMCQRYNMINLHPAAPGGPVGTWQEVIWKLMESRAHNTGAMMHLVTPELDQGPPVTFCTFPIRGQPFDRYWQEVEKQDLDQVRAALGESHPLFRLIREQGLKREFPLILATLKAFAQGRVSIQGGALVDGEGRWTPGYDLTEEIEQAIGGCRG